jgi:hypothetical protein
MNFQRELQLIIPRRRIRGEDSKVTRGGRGTLYALVASAFPLKAKSIAGMAVVEQLVMVADDTHQP